MNRQLGRISENDRDFDWFHQTQFGKIFNGDSYQFISNLNAGSVDLIITSPPFGLVREKEYGNVPADEYIDWFRPYATQFHRILKNSGSLFIDIGGVWNLGEPTRHLYHFKLLIMLCEEYNFKLAQDFYWHNPAKLLTPCGMGDGAQNPGEGRDQQGLVAVKDTVADSQQPARPPAL